MTIIGKVDDARHEPLKRAIVCKFCQAGTTHILGTYHNDSYADYENAKCGNCIDREIENKILELTPNSERAREVIVKRQQELDEKLRMDEYMSNLKQGNSNAHMLKDKGRRGVK